MVGTVVTAATVTEIECFLCNDLKGIMKCVDKATNVWAHIICVNWTPGIYFADELKTKIEGTLELERFDLTCHQCMDRKKGSCIQCDFKDCKVSRHVRCAVQSGMIFNWEDMEKMVGKNYATETYSMPVFCDRHRVQGCLNYREGGEETLKASVPKRKEPKKPVDMDKRRKILERQRQKQIENQIDFNKRDTLRRIKNIKNLVREQFMSKTERETLRKKNLKKAKKNPNSIKKGGFRKPVQRASPGKQMRKSAFLERESIQRVTGMAKVRKSKRSKSQKKATTGKLVPPPLPLKISSTSSSVSKNQSKALKKFY